MSEFNFYGIQFKVVEKIDGDNSDVDNEVVERILNRGGILTKQLHNYTVYKATLEKQNNTIKVPDSHKTFSKNDEGVFVENPNGEYFAALMLKPEFNKIRASKLIGCDIGDIVEIVEDSNSYIVRYTSEFYLYEMNIDEIAWFLKYYSYCKINSETYLDVNRVWVKIATIYLNEEIRNYE